MKKSKKILLKGMLVMVLMLMSMQGVDAAQSWGYAQVTIPTNDSVYLSQNVTASQNYKYVMHYVHNFSTQNNGNAAIHSEYYALYNGQTLKISGNDIKMTSTGGALWNPNNYSSSKPVGWTINATKVCSGTYTTNNYCAIQGSSYNLKMKNENWLYKITLNGQLTFTD